MNEPSSVSGSCYCGAVRFEVDLPTLFCGHCHCSMCRRSNGAAFVTWFAVPIERFRLLEAATLVRHRSSEHGTRSFCGRCGSPLFCENSHHSERIDVTLASMQGPIDRRPEAHLYYDCRAGWVEGLEELPKLGGASGAEKLYQLDGFKDRDLLLPLDPVNELNCWRACRACGLELTSAGGPLESPIDLEPAERVVANRATVRGEDGRI